MRTTKQTGFPTHGEWRIVVALYDLGGEAGVADVHAHVAGAAWSDSNTRTYLLKLCEKGWVEQYRPTTRFGTATGAGRPRVLYRPALAEREALARLADYLLEHYCFGREDRSDCLAGFLNGHREAAGFERPQSVGAQPLPRHEQENRPQNGEKSGER